MPHTQDTYTFEGFSAPNYTQVPDEFFDRVMTHLAEGELRAGLYIFRRTFGFKKQSDPISFNQFLHGITKQDGEVLDEGCGIRSPSHLSRALKGLEEKGIIVSHKVQDAKGGKQTTVYLLRFRQEGTTRTVVGGTTATVDTRNSVQETVEQETGVPLRHSSSEGLPSKFETAHTKISEEPDDEQPATRPASEPPRRAGGFEPIGMLLPLPLEGNQLDHLPTKETVQPSHGDEPLAVARRRRKKPDPETQDRHVIRTYIEETAAIVRDQAKLSSSLTRALRLYQQSGLPLAAFTMQIRQATRETQSRRGTLRAGHEMGYFFSLLSDYAGLKEHEPADAQAAEQTSGPAVTAGGTAAPARGRQKKTIGGPLVRVVSLRDASADRLPGRRPEAPAMAPERPNSGRSVPGSTNGPSDDSGP